MHTNVKTALGIFLFFFFGFLALTENSEYYASYINTLDDPIPLLTYFKPELFALVFMPLLFATGWRVWSRRKSLVFSLVSLRRSSRYFSQ